MVRLGSPENSRWGRLPVSWPLAYYRDKSFYTMRTDALDRFGTRLEQRFTRDQISGFLSAAGFCQVEFSRHVPYWVAVARKAQAYEPHCETVCIR